jgi:hypothetical protein
MASLPVHIQGEGNMASISVHIQGEGKNVSGEERDKVMYQYIRLIDMIVFFYKEIDQKNLK